MQGSLRSQLLLLCLIATTLLLGCSQDIPPSAADDATESGAAPPTDTGVDTAADTVTESESASETESDSGTFEAWVNPGCTAARNVVAENLRLDVEVDLAEYEEGKYAIREKITVTPRTAGNAVSFYGEKLAVKWASVGMAYNTHLATFCVADFAAGEDVTVEVEYVVDEANENALGLPFEVPMLQWGLRRYIADSGELMIGPFTEPYYAPFWLFVPQALHAVDTTNDDSPSVASVSLSVRVPSAEWTVIGPGGIGEQEDDVFHFQMDQPMPIYAFSFAASPDYELVSIGKTASGVEVQGALFPGTRTAALTALPAAITTIDWMEQHIGPYDFGKSLVFADVPKFGGGMEHVGVIWLGTETITPDAAGQFIVAHEMMHHWWGDNVRFADWPHFWLAEGFDEWSTNFNVMGEMEGAQEFAARKLDYRTQGAEMTYPFVTWLPIDVGPLRFADDDDMTVHFITDLQMYYTYGSVFLEMVNQRLLRDFDTDLNELLAAWFTAKRMQAVTTEDFLAFLQKATADNDGYWKSLFDDWVYKTPVPTLELTASSYADGVASVTLNRLKGGNQSLTALDVVFVAGDETFVAVVDLPAEAKQVVASVAMPVAPSRITVDPAQFYCLRLQTAKGWIGPSVGFSIDEPDAANEPQPLPTGE